MSNKDNVKSVHSDWDATYDNDVVVSAINCDRRQTPQHSYMYLYDHNNDVLFIVDTAAPKSLLPISLYPYMQSTGSIWTLCTPTQQTVRQTGTVDLTLEFDLFPNKRFDHKFLIADVYHPLLELDFLQKHKFVINTAKRIVTLDEVPILKIAQQFKPSLNNDELSYQDILALYTSVISGEMNKNYVSHSFEHTLEVEGPPIAQKPRTYKPRENQRAECPNWRNATFERYSTIYFSMEFSSPFGEEKDRQVALYYWLSPFNKEPSPFPTRCLMYMISQQTLMVVQCLVRLTSKTHFGNFLFDFLTENSQAFVHHVAILNFWKCHLVWSLLAHLFSILLIMCWEIFLTAAFRTLTTFLSFQRHHKNTNVTYTKLLTDSTHMAFHSTWKNWLLVWTTSIF